MNSDDQISPPKADAQLPPQELQSEPAPAPCLASRGNGFVARLPKAIREQLNQMMLDSVPYAEIIERLGDPASHLKPSHLSEWKKRGHQDWLLHQDWLAERRIRQESAGDILDNCDPNKVNQNGVGSPQNGGGSEWPFGSVLHLAKESVSGGADPPTFALSLSESADSDLPDRLAWVPSALTPIVGNLLLRNAVELRVLRGGRVLIGGMPGTFGSPKNVPAIPTSFHNSFTILLPLPDNLRAALPESFSHENHHSIHRSGVGIGSQPVRRRNLVRGP